jgi:hypothetical protein
MAKIDENRPQVSRRAKMAGLASVSFIEAVPPSIILP